MQTDGRTDRQTDRHDEANSRSSNLRTRLIIPDVDDMMQFFNPIAMLRTRFYKLQQKNQR